MTLFRFSAVLMLACVTATLAGDQPAPWSVELTVKRNRGSSPLIVVWLETADGKFVKTVKRCGRKAKYFKTLSAWSGASKGEKKKSVDAVTGATVKWGRKGRFTLPVKADAYDLAKGGYVLRIESNADKKRSYKLFKIPIGKDFKGRTFTHEGHVSKVTVSKTK
jgi:hypothetical protein